MADKGALSGHESADEGQMEIERVLSPNGGGGGGSGGEAGMAEDGREMGILRRSNSAPMFDGPNMTDESPVFQPIRERQRVRRFSANMSGNAKTPNPTTPVRVSSRIRQIQQEESLDVRSREAEHEREVQSAFQISHSCDEMSIGESIKALRSDTKTSFSEPLRILTSSLPIPSTPSPNRDRTPGKQCFSPSMQISMRSNSLTPSPIPSPTRQTSRVNRSMSPVLKPSLLNLKRRYDSDSDATPPPKRQQLLCSTSHNSSNQSICSLSSDEASPPQRSLSDAPSSLAIPVSTSESVFAFAMGEAHL